MEPNAQEVLVAPQERHISSARKHSTPTELIFPFMLRFYKHSAPTELMTSRTLAKVLQPTHHSSLCCLRFWCRNRLGMTFGNWSLAKRHVTFCAREIRIFLLRVILEIQNAAFVGCRRNVTAIRTAA